MPVRHLTRTAVFVLLEKNDSIFLLRRANTGWNDGKWTLPSGHVDQGETVKQAAAKEALEEAGVTILESDLEFVYVHYIHDTYTNFYFRAKTWEGEPVLNEPELCSEIGWFPKDALPGDLIRHVREMLDGIKNGEQFSDTPNDMGDGTHDGSELLN